MSLASFTMYVRPKKTLSLRGHSGRLINGLVYTLLDEVSPLVASEEHPPQPIATGAGPVEESQEKEPKPKATRRINGFTTSWVQGALRRDGTNMWATPDELYKIRFTTLREPVYHALGSAVVRRLTEGRGVGIGVGGEVQDNFRIERLGLAPYEQDPWVALSDYETIWRASEGRRTVTLRFASPTAFQTGNLQSLFPTPASVFHGLLLKWNAFTPSGYHLAPEGWQTLEQQVAVSRYELRTEVIRAGKFMLKGFTGWVEYDLKEASPEVTRTIEVLARYALYAGVGKKTTQGMGQCRAELE